MLGVNVKLLLTSDLCHVPNVFSPRSSRKHIGKRIRSMLILSMVLDLPVPDDWIMGIILA
jgi:hypothetical protein